ncbi:MAG: hypothetical protein Q8P49_03360 [Candidatus Liptonbacteria bacterium]|nr:hypothetical protein [Candidatus Liptonbacteria bacterium]
MRTVSVRLECSDRQAALRIWGIRKGEEEKLVIAVVRVAGGLVDPECVRGGDGEIVIYSSSDPGSLQKIIVDRLKEVLPRVKVCGKTKNGSPRAAEPVFGASS